MAKKVPSIADRERKGFSSSDYNYVAMRSKLRLISLTKSSFEVNSDCLRDKKHWKLSYDWNVLACHFDASRGSSSGLFQYLVTAKLGRKIAMRCIAEYVVYYDVPEESENEAAEGFCHNVGPFAAYPYFRSFVAQCTADANLLLPPLPMIASTAHIQKKPKSESETKGDG